MQLRARFWCGGQAVASSSRRRTSGRTSSALAWAHGLGRSPAPSSSVCVMFVIRSPDAGLHARHGHGELCPAWPRPGRGPSARTPPFAALHQLDHPRQPHQRPDRPSARARARDPAVASHAGAGGASPPEPEPPSLPEARGAGRRRLRAGRLHQPASRPRACSHKRPGGFASAACSSPTKRSSSPSRMRSSPGCAIWGTSPDATSWWTSATHAAIALGWPPSPTS